MKTKNLSKNEFVMYGVLIVITVAAVVSLVIHIAITHEGI